jgi:hypothetical protein
MADIWLMYGIKIQGWVKARRIVGVNGVVKKPPDPPGG